MTTKAWGVLAAWSALGNTKMRDYVVFFRVGKKIRRPRERRKLWTDTMIVRGINRADAERRFKDMAPDNAVVVDVR